MTEERKQELLDEWDLSDDMDAEEYRDWYENLPLEEQAQIDAWDKQFDTGMYQLCAENLRYDNLRKS